MEILLASGSPRRQSLLNSFGFEVKVIKPQFDESSVCEKDPERLVLSLAAGKMSSVETGDALALSADTVVAIDGNILGKPKSAQDAFEMLSMLSDNTHTVYTGVCITCKDKQVLFCDKSNVTFHKLTKHQINEYINTKSPFDKAGSYGIQDPIAMTFVKYVEGEISNVIGLPIGRVITEIERITR